jgi:predicted esterase YcpF (UPF0227 family)
LVVTDILKLNGCKIEESSDKKKPYSFTIIFQSGDKIHFAASDQATMKSWIDAINENKDKEIGGLSQGTKKVRDFHELYKSSEDVCFFFLSEISLIWFVLKLIIDNRNKVE